MNTGYAYGTGGGYATLLSQIQANPAQQQVLPGWRHVPGVGTLPMGNMGGQPSPPILPPPDLGGGGMQGGGMGGGMGGRGGVGISYQERGQPMPGLIGGAMGMGGGMGGAAGGMPGVMGQPSGGMMGRLGGFLENMGPDRRRMLGLGLGMMNGGLGI